MIRLDALLALAIAGVLATYAASKARSGRWGEMLFGCHVASALTVMGLLAGSDLLVGAGFVFYLGVGLPSWIIDCAAKRRVEPVSVVAHLLPTLAAGQHVARAGLPRGSSLLAWAMFVALLPL